MGYNSRFKLTFKAVPAERDKFIEHWEDNKFLDDLDLLDSDDWETMKWYQYTDDLAKVSRNGQKY
jgi:hypothetical protein